MVFYLGKWQLERGIFLAPMEDVTDLPFRLLCKRLGADVVYTEFVNARELLRGNPRMRRKLAFLEEERPVGAQIYGSETGDMAGAARIVESLQPDFIDINCGCWVKDVAGRGAGAGFLRDLPALARMATSVVRAVQLPVTLKTRLGWDADTIRILDVARICEDAGIRALTVHCRTRVQGHSGDVDYSWIPRLKAAVRIPIVVNGDITTAGDVRRVFDTTGCDAVMIGRGAIRNPHVFREAKHLLETGHVLPTATHEARLQVFREHVALSVQHLGPKEAVAEVRRHYLAFLRGLPQAQAIRDALLQAQTADAVVAVLEGEPRHFVELERRLAPARSVSYPSGHPTRTAPTSFPEG